ncbi:MAG: hypothetical protein J6A15_00920 [Clostridia bacterium]|nr:hypothetical protein [Clostridia bacterium]
MTKEVNAQINFQKNCEYESSTANRTIFIEPQSVEIEITIVNPNNELYNKEKNYYDEVLEITASVFQTQSNGLRKTIQTGRIEFYYQADDSNNIKLINKDSNSCVLTTNGTAGVIYRPEKSGKIIAKYIDDKEWYKTTEQSATFKLYPIPIDIKFIKKPPYLTHLEDSVELQVQVTKRYPKNENDVLNYGVVTFLHYLEHYDMDSPNKRIERVIGNPVIVKDGIATIKYIPIQEYSDIEPTQLIDNIEYIRAIYNYDNDLYYASENDTYSYEVYYYEEELQTNKWQYYGSANTYTNIAIYKPNSVTIGVSNKTLSVDKMYHYAEDENIILRAILYDDDEQIILQQDDVKTLTFHVIGTYSTFNNNLIENYNQDNFIYHPYELDVNYDNYNNGIFTATLPKLKPGVYTVQASTNGQIINGEVKIYQNTGNTGIVDEDGHIKKDTVEIRTDKYLDKIDISNMLYIQSEFKTINFTNILKATNNTVKTHNNINLSAELTINDDYKNILINQKCYFVDNRNNKKYEGKILQENNKLVLKPTEDINFNIAGDYPMHAYIPPGYYTDGSKYIFIDYNSSNTLIIQARDTISLDYSQSYISDTAYGNIKYTLSCPNMFIDYTEVDLTIEKDSRIIQKQTYYFTTKTTQFTNHFPNLQAGLYSIYAHIKDTNERVQLGTAKILKDNITQSIQDSSKIINANPFGTIELFISSINKHNLDLIDLSKMHFYLQESNKAYNIELAEETNNYSIKNRTRETIDVLIEPRTYLPKEWYVGVSYEGDDNFNDIICLPNKFKTVLVEPNIVIEHNRIDSILLTLNNNINNVNVIGRITFLQNNTPLSAESVFITDKEGECLIDNVPTECNGFKIVINPYDEDFIELIESDSYAQLLKYEYNVYEMKNDAIYDIGEQYNISNKTCLFAMYDSIDVNIARNVL